MFYRNAAIVAVSALATVASAGSNFTLLDPDSVDTTTRAQWCVSQENACTTICNNDPTTNSCDTTSLDYSCICSGNVSPDLTEYTGTLPYFICESDYATCITDNANDAAGQKNCTDTYVCGSETPAALSTTSTTAAASSTGTATAAATSASVASTTTSAGGAMPTNFQRIGNSAAAVAVGVLAYML